MGVDRRTLVYVIVDTSASMAGAAIESVNQALAGLKQRLADSAETLEHGVVSLITFNDVATHYDFVPVDEFDPPMLFASGGCSLGAALHALLESLQLDVAGTGPGYRGDRRPLAILIIGGAPTDAYEANLQALSAMKGFRRPTVIVVACGEAVDTSYLRPITAITLPVRQLTPETLAQAFGTVARTIVSSSRGVPESALVSPLVPGR